MTRISNLQCLIWKRKTANIHEEGLNDKSKLQCILRCLKNDLYKIVKIVDGLYKIVKIVDDLQTYHGMPWVSKAIHKWIVIIPVVSSLSSMHQSIRVIIVRTIYWNVVMMVMMFTITLITSITRVSRWISWKITIVL